MRERAVQLVWIFLVRPGVEHAVMVDIGRRAPGIATRLDRTEQESGRHRETMIEIVAHIGGILVRLVVTGHEWLQQVAVR